jgi:hypothetical protein
MSTTEYQRAGIGTSMICYAIALLGKFWVPPSGEVPPGLDDIPDFQLEIEGASFLNSITRKGILPASYRYPVSQSSSYDDWKEPYSWW